MVSTSAALATRPRPDRFADPTCLKQGWYLLGPSHRWRRGRLRPVQVGPRRLVAYRDLDGAPHVVDDRCAHLGADLARGRVTRLGLECAFHGWCWDGTGACSVAPGYGQPPSRRLRNYVTHERWGFLWAWMGEQPAFPLPDVPLPRPRRWTLMPQRVRAHADVVFANGFDMAHFGPSHDIDARTASLDVATPWSIAHRIEGTLPRRPRLAWAGLAGKPLDATFTQYGGGVVQVHVRRPLEYVILFTIRPDAQGHSRTRTMLFLRRRRDAPRALALLWATALDDLGLMESIGWIGAFASGDGVLKRYAQFVEEMPTW